MAVLNPESFVITRKRKKYKFALFANSPLCFEVGEYDKSFSPNILEVGAGTGIFSFKSASLYNKKKFLACDVKADRLQKGSQMAELKNLNNIRFLRAHANQLEDVLSTGKLEKIWLTFPDPFPKKRQSKHRLTHPNFLALYYKLLTESGKLYLKTDNHELFDWSLEQIVSPGWIIEELTYDLHGSKLKDDYKLTTTYEEKFLSQNETICFVSARPPSAVAASRQ